MTFLINKIFDVPNLIDNSFSLIYHLNNCNNNELANITNNNKFDSTIFNVNDNELLTNNILFDFAFEMKERCFIFLTNINHVTYFLEHNFLNFSISINDENNLLIPTIKVSNSEKQRIIRSISKLVALSRTKISLKITIPFINILPRTQQKLNTFIVSEIVFYNSILDRHTNIKNFVIEIYDKHDIMENDDIVYLSSTLNKHKINFNNLFFCFNVSSSVYLRRFNELAYKLINNGFNNLSVVCP